MGPAPAVAKLCGQVSLHINYRLPQDPILPSEAGNATEKLSAGLLLHFPLWTAAQQGFGEWERDVEMKRPAKKAGALVPADPENGRCTKRQATAGGLRSHRICHLPGVLFSPLKTILSWHMQL